MTKDANILPNLRVDIPDFKQATSVLGRGNAKAQRKLVFQDKSSAIAEGFLVEIRHIEANVVDGFWIRVGIPESLNVQRADLAEC